MTPFRQTPVLRSGPAAGSTRRTVATRAAAALIAGSVLVSVAACSSSGASSSSATTPAGTGAASAAGVGSTSSSGAGGGVDSAAAAMLPASIKSSGTLSIGANLPNPPLEYQVNGTGAFTGFDIDLATATAAKLGLKFSASNLAFTALLTSLDAGRIDLVWSALFDTPARQVKYSIVDYLQTGSQIFTTPANAGKAPDIASLCGQTVETAVGTAFIDQLKTLSTQTCAGKEPIKVLAVGGSFAEEVLQITTGRAIAAISTTDNVAYSDTTDPGKYVNVGDAFDKVPYGVDVPKADAGLTRAIQLALTDLVNDGTYASIVSKYKLDAGKLSAITVDAGK